MKTPTTPRSLATLFAAAALALGAALAQPALAMPGDHGGPGGPGGPAGMFGHPRMAERLLDSVNATAEQRSQIRTLMDAARKDMDAQRDSGRALRDQAMTLFGQPTVDARAAESLRQQMLAQHDAASKRATQLMLDVSRVLTPEQRKQMVERMGQHRAMMERHQQERRQLERPKS